MTHFDNSHSVWNESKMPFFEVSVSPVLTQNPDIWNFYRSRTLNTGKIIQYFKSPWYAIVSNITHFHSVLHERKMALFKLWISPVLNIGKLI